MKPTPSLPRSFITSRSVSHTERGLEIDLKIVIPDIFEAADMHKWLEDEMTGTGANRLTTPMPRKMDTKDKLAKALKMLDHPEIEPYKDKKAYFMDGLGLSSPYKPPIMIHGV